MAHPFHHASFDLPKGELLRLDDMSGITLHCLSGTLWLTLDNDPKDVVLEAGDSFVTTAHRRAIVYALAPASARLLHASGACSPRGAAPGLAPWLQWLRSRLRGTTAAPT